MSGERSAEKPTEADRFANQRMLHEIDVPDGARKQGTEGEENRNTVWPKLIAMSHRAGHEGSPESHQYAGHDTGDNAFARDGFSCARKASVGFTDHDHSDQGTEHAACKQGQVAYWLQDVAQHNSDDESDSD